MLAAIVVMCELLDQYDPTEIDKKFPVRFEQMLAEACPNAGCEGGRVAPMPTKEFMQFLKDCRTDKFTKSMFTKGVLQPSSPALYHPHTPLPTDRIPPQRYPSRRTMRDELTLTPAVDPQERQAGWRNRRRPATRNSSRGSTSSSAALGHSPKRRYAGLGTGCASGRADLEANW
jgi:hypothetical protein